MLEELRLAQPEDVDRLDNVPRVADRLLPRTTSLLLSLAPVILKIRVLIVLEVLVPMHTIPDLKPPTHMGRR